MNFDYEVVRSKRATAAIQIKDGRVIVRCPLSFSDSDVSSLVEKHRRWIEKNLQRVPTLNQTDEDRFTKEELDRLADEALERIPPKVERYAKMLGVAYGKITVRPMRSRWGSCSSNGSLAFNTLLMLTPDDVIDSVVVHELCHRLEMNHSPRFYEKVLGVFPNYYESNKYLKTNGAALIARLPK